jgi:flavorubredoxin
MKTFIHHLVDHNYQNRRVALVENGSWAPAAAKAMTAALAGAKNLTFADNSVRILSAMTEDTKVQIQQLAQELWP